MTRLVQIAHDCFFFFRHMILFTSLHGTINKG
jgi:hypothetical protein